jgi:FkbM family methyltransferase
LTADERAGSQYSADAQGRRALSETRDELDQELEELLAEGVEGARRREAAAFDDLVGTNTTQFVLFGAGNLGRRTLVGLRKLGIEPRCFIDSNKARWGESLHGLQVLSPEEGAQRFGTSATFVVTVWGALGTDRMASRVAALRSLGCNSVVPFVQLYWKFPELFMPHYTVDLPSGVHLQAGRVRQAFRLMGDEVSRREFLAQLRFRLLGDFAVLPQPVQGAIYFREELFKLEKDETFVDCGAFDGDTLGLFLEKTGNSFKTAIAIEPDPSNYSKLVEQVNRLPLEVRQRIVLHQVATGGSDSRVRMDVGNGAASQVGSGDFEIDCVALDTLLKDVPVSFIKMDIEGSELATLAGAQTLIRQDEPILTISAYHKQDDLWNIPLFIHGISSDYSFYLRPHMLEGWDLVCYAIPSKRRRQASQ